MTFIIIMADIRRSLSLSLYIYIYNYNRLLGVWIQASLKNGYMKPWVMCVFSLLCFILLLKYRAIVLRF